MFVLNNSRAIVSIESNSCIWIGFDFGFAIERFLWKRFGAEGIPFEIDFLFSFSTLMTGDKFRIE